jgi:hypothetical protein
MQLYQPMPIMIWIAIIVEAAIQNWLDMGILLGIQFANAFIGWCAARRRGLRRSWRRSRGFFPGCARAASRLLCRAQHARRPAAAAAALPAPARPPPHRPRRPPPRYETTKAGDAVAALKASLKPTATAKRDGKWQKIDAGGLVPGDMVLLAAGSAIPADCLVNHGQIEVDQSALTGESLPVTMYAGDSAKMGSNVVRGEQEGTVEVCAGGRGGAGALEGGLCRRRLLRCSAARLHSCAARLHSCGPPGMLTWRRRSPNLHTSLPSARSSPGATPSSARPRPCCRAPTSWATSRRSCCS